MEASTDLSLKQAFVLKSEHIRRLLESLSTKVGNTSISAKCEDGINRNFDSLDHLLSYSNPPTSKIQSLSFRARSGDYKTSVRVIFANQIWGSIQFEVEGPEDFVISLRDDLTKTAAMTKAWYDRFARLDIFNLIFAIGITGVAILLLFIVIGIIGSDKLGLHSNNARSQALGYLLGVGFTGSLLFLGTLISRFRTKLFPIGTFAWGDAAEKHEFLEKVRWTIVIGFIVSFLSGIVASVIMRLA
jgi:hypothetical protein